MKQNREYKKSLNKYIKESLSKGYSLEAVKKAFIKHGYEPDFADSLIKEYKLKRVLIRAVPLFLILLLSISIILFLKPNITTLVVKTKDYSFTENIGLTFNESADYEWNLENKGLLKSVKLNGEVKTNGTVKIYLEHENQKYLVFDNKKLEGGLGDVTVFAVKEVKIEVKSESNLTEEEQIILDNLISDINKTRKNVEIEIEIEESEVKKEIKGNLSDGQQLLVDTLISILANRNEDVKIKIESEFEEIEAPEGIINETINITEPINGTNITIPINITPAINETENISINKIEIILDYKKDSAYDKDDNGIENIDGAIDFTVEDTEFNWEVNEENLCTAWNTYSVDNGENTLVCYGSSKCCNFVNLLPTRSGWDETFYATYGAYGAALNNIVSAQVLYVDYNLSLDDPFAEVHYSDWKNLTAKFYQGFIRFENACIETCILPSLNATNYKIIIEINDSGLILDSVTYEVLDYETTNSPPILLKNFTNISFFKDESYTINLSEYFYDSENDTLFFDFYNRSEVNVAIINGTAILSSDKPVDSTYMFFIANDSKDTTISNIFEIEVKKQQGKIFDFPGLKSLRKLIGLE